MDRYDIAMGKRPQPKPVEPIRPTEATVVSSSPWPHFTASSWHMEDYWSTISKIPCPICDTEAPQEKQEKTEIVRGRKKYLQQNVLQKIPEKPAEILKITLIVNHTFAAVTLLLS